MLCRMIKTSPPKAPAPKALAPKSDSKPAASFFGRDGLDLRTTQDQVERILHGSDDGELFLEQRVCESLVFDDGRVREASSDHSQGFGLRCIVGEAVGYAHATELSSDALARAGEAVQSVKQGGKSMRQPVAKPGAPPRVKKLYSAADPLRAPDFAAKADLLKKIDSYLRKKDNRVRQVSVSLAGEWQKVAIVRADAPPAYDVRPLVRLDVSVMVGAGERQESGHCGRGGRANYHHWLTADNWRSQADEALRQALVNLESVAAPAGEMDVLLGPGWPGILLHEAIGHGLEGDFNRKKTSAFSGLRGERIASKGVTVVDDGTLANRRGSLSMDDEGTPSSRTVLIEDGILKNYMQDRLNARLMGEQATGNGRRESFVHPVLPRMTNTFMLGGAHDPQEMRAAVKQGIYAVAFGGGQVDITSGKFVFSCTEAYRLENGRIGAPIKGATLIGNGPDALTRIAMIGNDMQLDEGIGTCGKEGQGVPVGVGQPSLLLRGLTVGGTA